MKYFLHDTNSFQDEKITMLFMEYGYEGLGLFYTLLEKIGLQEKPVKTEVLKRQLHVGKKLEKCWSFMEEIELISSNNGETFNERILSYSETYQIKNKKTLERVRKFRSKQTENQEDTENVKRYETVTKRERNAPKVKESKVNRSKVNKESLVLPDFSDGFIEMWEVWKQYKKDEHKFNYKTVQSEQAALNELVELAKGLEENATAIIKQSMAKGWKGFFALKTEINGAGFNKTGTGSTVTSEQLNEAHLKYFGS